MKSHLFFVLLALVICFSTIAEPVSIAVSNIEPLGVDEDTAFMVEELLQIEFSQHSLFRVVERSKMNALMKEQRFQLSGVTDVENAIKAGNLLNAKKVLFGALAYYGSEYVEYLLTLRMVDIEKGEIEAAESIEIKSADGIRTAVSEIVDVLIKQVEITGEIIAVEEESVFTSLGEYADVVENNVLSVFLLELIKGATGNVIMREEVPVANLLVEKVSTEGSRCRVLETAGEIEPGMTVRRGETDIDINEEECRLLIKSIPENARVFIDSKFMGLTPVEVAGMAPGSYIIDIRAGAGYKAYRGRVNLKKGRSITIERELEQEIEVEDILLIGKMPRKQTDPSTALKKALIPGFGAIYNGYPGQAPVIMFSTIMSGILPIILGLTEEGGFSPYQIIQGGTGVMIYLSSLLDAWQTADDRFTYPTYGKILMGPAGAFIREDSDDSAVIGMTADYQYEGRSYSFYISISPLVISRINTDQMAWLMNMGMYYRFIKSERLFVGLGYEITNNFINYDDSNDEEGSPDAGIPGMLCSPALSLSYISNKFELDFSGSPYSHDTFGYSDGHTDFIGFTGRLNLNYFFNLKVGGALSAEYADLRDLNDLSYKLQLFRLKTGVIIRL